MSDQPTTADTATTDAPQGTDGGDGTTSTETPTVEDLLAKVEELTKHSRKWEDRAKTNKEKADRLDALERERMTDSERAEADRAAMEQRVTEAENRATAAEAELARYKVANEFGLSPEDAEALASITDEATLRALAERLAGRKPGTQRPNPAQGRAPKTAPTTPAQAFADALGDLF